MAQAGVLAAGWSGQGPFARMLLAFLAIPELLSDAASGAAVFSRIGWRAELPKKRTGAAKAASRHTFRSTSFVLDSKRGPDSPNISARLLNG
jgi:hypothetical protein